MDVTFLNQLRGNLLEKRRIIDQWLRSTPQPKQRMNLGPAGEQGVQQHLHTLDVTVESADNQTFGICTVCGETVDTSLLEMDYTACVCLDHYSPEEMRNLEAELELATVVQRALLPQSVPDVPGLQLAVYSRPSQIVGGDYFDFVQFRNGAFGLALADVAGHGIAASMLMATIQTALRGLIPQSDSPAAVLREVNRIFNHNIHFTTFVTLFLGAFDPSTRKFTYSNAGHNPPLWMHRSDGRPGSVDWLAPTGAAIGLVEDFTISEGAIPFTSDDILLLYTDGVTEAVNPQTEEFGQARLSALVCQAAHLSAQELVHRLRQELETFTSSQGLSDDATIIAVMGR
jgi:sigma-B regulation protein RsbU (phosphoserine phosphatase)